ncbi:MAG TPA: protein kinase [Gemmatimonadaceae bacterium]
MTRGPSDTASPASPGGDTPPARTRPAPAPPSATLAGALADRYAVEHEIGRGGMATVWLAEELKHGRKVAIKVLHPDLAASLGAERFLREIGIAARLAHPHIVPLIDSGEAGELLYYVSPYIPGGSLRARLDREPRLPVREALRIGQEIAAALDFAHRSGFVHRDVKPENILFADGHAVLADFGVALVAGGDHRDGERVTEAGIALGTPEYMSPEQAAGERALDGASDIYSLACVVYEMLAGAPPFEGTTPRATMARHVTESPRAVRTHRPDTPPGAERALDRALAKNPPARQPSAAAFAAELVADVPEHAYGASLTRSIAVLPFVNASSDPENEYLSDGITDELIDALAKVEGLRVASRTSVFALKGKPNDVRAIGALLGASVVLEGTVRKSGSRLRITAQLGSADDGRLLWSQRYDRTLHDVFEIQDEIARTIVGTLRATSLADLGEPEPVRRTESVAAYGLYLRGRYEWNKRTQEGIAEGIRYFEQAIAADPQYALAYTGLSDSYALQVDYRSIPASEGLERAKMYARMALALDDTLAEAHASLAWVLFIHEWKWEEARRAFQRAIELDPRYASAHQWYAFLLAALGRQEEALVEAHAALELDPASVSVRRGVGWIYFYGRRWERARHHVTRAIAMNPLAEESYRVLGMTLALEGKLGEAERVLREAVTMHGSGTYSRSTLGYVLALAGRTAEARGILAELAQQRRAEYVSPVSFATIHLALGELEPALDWAERALEERRGWLAYLRVNPIFDPLRGHPRFEALCRAMGL